VIEMHGNFNSVTEMSTGSYSSVQQIDLAESTDYTEINITINHKKLQIVQCNNNNEISAKHSYRTNDKTIEFTGPYTVVYDNTMMK